MTHNKLIPFDRPLIGTVTPGRTGRLYTESEYAAYGEASYRRGVDAARSLADQQMVEIRDEVAQLSGGILSQLTNVDTAILRQLHDALPALALDIAKHLLAGYEPPPEMIDRLCRDALDQLFPERENLELILCPRDAELLTKLNPGWLERYPGLKMRADVALTPGDCQVRSRFGLTDARQQTKLEALGRALSVA
jgi:flagellar assembly protein FliH